MANNTIHFNNGRTLKTTLQVNAVGIIAFPDNIHQTYMIFFYPAPSYPVHMRERTAADVTHASEIDGIIPQGLGVTWGRRRGIESLSFLNGGATAFTVYVQPVTTFL